MLQFSYWDCLTGSVGYSFYKNQITETVLVETAVQNKYNKN
jgi:hypothetical protein